MPSDGILIYRKIKTFRVKWSPLFKSEQIRDSIYVNQYYIVLKISTEGTSVIVSGFSYFEIFTLVNFY